MQYKGFVFSDEFERGKKSGHFSIEFGSITFYVDEHTLYMPIDDQTQMKLSGASDRLVFITHPDCPDVTFCFSDKSVLSNPTLKQFPAFSQQLIQIKKKKWAWRSVILSILVLLVLGIGLTVVCYDMIINKAAQSVPFEYEQKIGDYLFESLTQDKVIINDEPLLSQIINITQPLLDVVKRESPEYTFDFYIIKDESINAFALPGGQIVIHSGLLLKASHPDQIAGVLGHEIAHVTCRHHLRSLLKKAGLLVAISVLTDGGSSLATIIEGAGVLVFLQNSRAFEREADDQGLYYLNEANINPQGLIDFFKLLEKEYGDTHGEMDFLSTHPATDDRIEVLQKKIANFRKQNQFIKLDLDLPKFQMELQSALNALPQTKEQK